MLQWIDKKGEDARVYMCIKEIKGELGVADGVQRATIMAMAQLLRQSMFNDTGTEGVADRPLDYSRSELMQFYGGLESIRNQSAVEIERTKANMLRLGMTLPQFAIDHAKNTSRGLEIWMCTLGAGICPNRREDVRDIWSYLTGSLDYIAVAITNIKEIERRTCEMTGAGPIFGLSYSEWFGLCEYVPSMFRTRALMNA